MKNLMMDTVYGEIDKATTWKHLQKVEGIKFSGIKTKICMGADHFCSYGERIGGEE